MNYQLIFKDDSEIILSSSTFSQAIQYSKTTGKELSMITLFQNEIVVLDQSSIICFAVNAKNTQNNERKTYLVFHTDIDVVNNWIQSQSNLEITQIIKTEKSLIIS